MRGGMDGSCVVCGGNLEHGDSWYWGCARTGGWGIVCHKCGHSWHVKSSPRVVNAACPRCGCNGVADTMLELNEKS